MGSRAAYREAVRKWGKAATILIQNDLCHVGDSGWFTGRPVIKGSGKTWALAFKNADERAGKPVAVRQPEEGEGGA